MVTWIELPNKELIATNNSDQFLIEPCHGQYILKINGIVLLRGLLPTCKNRVDQYLVEKEELAYSGKN